MCVAPQTPIFYFSNSKIEFNIAYTFFLQEKIAEGDSMTQTSQIKEDSKTLSVSNKESDIRSSAKHNKENT